MREPFTAIDAADLVAAIEQGWGETVHELAPHLVGAGAHHWFATTAGGRRFVTVDDLDAKAWLGDERVEVDERLHTAYGVAAVLAGVAGPRPAADGSLLVPLDDRYRLSIYDAIEGVPGRWGTPLSPDECRAMVQLLARIHQRTPDAVAAGVGRQDLAEPRRSHIDDALVALDEPWTDGPHGELARQRVSDHRDTITGWLDELNRAVERFDDPGTEVVTHGEPHPGNVLRTNEGLVLVDWDTVGLAPPERDLWMLAEAHPAAVADYEALTGVKVRGALLHAYRVRWTLSDVSFNLEALRAPHTEASAGNDLRYLGFLLAGTAPAPYGIGAQTLRR